MQGELFLRFRDRLAVNKIPLSTGTKADISADLRVNDDGDVEVDGPHPMVGELKLLGSGSYTKTITGNGITEFKALPLDAQGRRNVTYAWARNRVGTWGLVPDYVRLRGARTLPQETERILVLVAWIGSTPEWAETTMANALETIHFDGAQVHERALGKFGFARAWSL